MSENSKIKRNNYNDEVVKRVAEKIGVTRHFVRAALRGDRTSETADLCKKQYKEINKNLTEFIKEQ